MINATKDTRVPLPKDTVIELVNGDVTESYTISTLVSSAPLSMKYLAMTRDRKGYTSAVILKELFPKSPLDMLATRDEDGAVLFTSPDGEYADPEIYCDCFDREVSLCSASRNSRDKLAVPETTGPYASRNGGLFLVTRLPYRSRFLGSFAPEDKKDSFGRKEGLSDILDIMSLACDKLCDLHENRGILHLSLSHSNIYCARNDRVRAFDVSITDFATAIEYKNISELDDTDLLRISSNEYSAPELCALASTEPYMRRDCGYTLGKTCDTYSLCAMLYKIIFGRGFNMEDYGSEKLRRRILSLYPRTAYPGFAMLLEQLLLKGLCPVPSGRFETFAELKVAIDDLADALRDRTLLCGTDPHSYLPYILFSEHPFYEVAEKNGDMSVLFVGSTNNVIQLTLAAMSAGQTARGRLNIYAVSENAAELSERLAATVPTLSINDDGGICSESLSVKVFDKSFADDSTFADEIASFANGCRYAVVSLEDERENTSTAVLVGEALERAAGKKPKLFVYTSDTVYKPGKLAIRPAAFGENLERCAEAARELGLLAQKIDVFTVSTENPGVSAKKREPDFISDPEAVISALCSAVHIKYKLRSVGINPKKGGTAAAIEYAEKLSDEGTRRVLIELEHRRRMLYAASKGFRAPTYADFDSYAYRFEGRYFNRSLDSGSALFHRCLVPCSVDAPLLPEDISTLKIKALSDIEKSPYDELGKMSLMSALYLRERTVSSEERNRIVARFGDAVSAVIARAGKDKAPLLTSLADQLSAKLMHCMKKGDISELDGELSYLQKVYTAEGQNISDVVRVLKCELSVFEDCNIFTDLGAIDRLTVDNLHLFCINESITLIKPAGRMKIDNAAGALILRPERLVLVGSQDSANYSRFFKGKGMDTEVTHVMPEAITTSGLYLELDMLCDELPGRIVFDITGSTPLHTAAVMMLASKREGISVIRCDEITQRLENVCGFELSPLYRSKYEISARESYGLFGAREKNDNEEDYLEELGDCIPDVWQVYLEHRDRWDKLVYLIALCERDEFHASNIPLGQNLEHRRYTRKMTRSVLESTCIEPVLRLLAAKRAILNLNIDRSFGGFVSVSYDAPVDRQFFTARLEALFDRLYEQKLDYTVHESPENKGIFTLNVSSGRYCRMESAKLKTVPYKEALPILYSLEEKGLVFITKDPGTGDEPGDLECLCCCPGILKMLLKAGNVLEAYVWYAAKKSGYFDDIRANFKFTWTDPDISNELDVILTKGLSSTVISCKTTNKTENMHLYEVKYLTEHFTVNSKAVIVYAIDNQAQLENMQRRAAAMGISVISLADLATTDKLIARLCEICK